MGYTTSFDGDVTLDKPLTKEQIIYLQKFNETRRVEIKDGSDMPCPIREAAGLPLGEQGKFNVIDVGWDDERLADYNSSGMAPSLWCQWTIDDEGLHISWDEGEKFYDYIEWMKFIIDEFIKPWGHVANGTITWQGEDSDDYGLLIVENNVVYSRIGRRSYGQKRKV